MGLFGAPMDLTPERSVTSANSTVRELIAQRLYLAGAFCGGGCEYTGWDACSDCREVCLNYADVIERFLVDERRQLIAAYCMERNGWMERAHKAEAEAERLRDIAMEAVAAARPSKLKWADMFGVLADEPPDMVVTAIQNAIGCERARFILQPDQPWKCAEHRFDEWTDRGCPVAVAAADAAWTVQATP